MDVSDLWAYGKQVGTSKAACQRQVALFAPNLIGYFRLGLLGAALRTGTTRPTTTFWLFAVNLLLDGVDGIAARRLNQASLWIAHC